MATKKEARSEITAEWVRENLAYVPETGVFMWKIAGQGRNMERAIGTTVWPGYRVLKLRGQVFYAHRVAWLYVNGEWPAGSVDHIDSNMANNAIANLRLATAAQNAARRPATAQDAAVAEAVRRAPHRDWLTVATPGFVGGRLG